jgi:Putative lumazine-binding
MAMRHEAEVTFDDRERIEAAAIDYMESWLDGDPERMGRCLHPDLAKRSIEQGEPGTPARVEESPRDVMIEATAKGYGTLYERPYEVTILDTYGDIATVRLLSAPYMDYLHIARFGEEWLIINVLWQRRSERSAKDLLGI